MLLAIVTSMAIAGSQPNAQARPTFLSFISGHELFEACSETISRAVCASYVAGIADGLEHAVIKGSKRLICYPEKANVGQMTDVTRKYLSDNPEKRHLPASLLVFNALSVAFPCASN